MRKGHALVALALLATPAIAQIKAALPSGKGVVHFGETFKGSPERQVVEIFAPELKDQPMSSALYDLAGEGKADIVVKLSGPKACDPDGKRCRTMVFRAAKTGWMKALDRPADTIEATDVGYAGVRSLSLDGGREVYAWDRDGYKLDITTTGKPVTFSEAPAASRALLISQFGAGAQALSQKSKGVTVKVASLPLKDDGTTLIMAQLEGPGACGRQFGCPWRLLQVKDKQYVVVSEGLGAGKAAVMPVARGGYRDLAVDLPNGHAVYGWTGSKYVMAERNEGARR